jgi:hypothetical protein
MDDIRNLNYYIELIEKYGLCKDNSFLLKEVQKVVNDYSIKYPGNHPVSLQRDDLRNMLEINPVCEIYVYLK